LHPKIPDGRIFRTAETFDVPKRSLIRHPSDLTRAKVQLTALLRQLIALPHSLIASCMQLITPPSDLIRATVSLISRRRTMTPCQLQLIASPS
jgi:hypothetical protein